MDILSECFSFLSEFKQFIIYKVIAENDKNIKQPVNYITGLTHSPFDSNIWTDSKTAIISAKLMGANYGVGFVLTEDDPFFLLDIDKCYDPIKKEWSQVSKHLLSKFRGAAVEISTSKQGLHIIGTCEQINHSCKNKEYGIELYTKNRFIALTGINVIGDCSKNCTNEIKELALSYFNPSQSTQDFWWSNEPVSQWKGHADDNELIEFALKSQSSKSIFGDGINFSDLWNANEEALSRAYASSTGDIFDRSSADAALALHLAFWTGKNAQRILELMWKSKLMRPKWDRKDYLPRTIRAACGRSNKVANYIKDTMKVANPNNTEKTQEGQVLSSYFLTLSSQKEYFKNCVYICDEDSIFIPGGHVLNQSRFNAMYGGKVMTLDTTNQKIAKSPWEAFLMTRGPKNPKVHGACFKPVLKPGEIIEEENELLVNTYWPLNIPYVPGDITPFLNHMKLLLQNKEDEIILLSYMAAIVQYLGVKFQWCPFIQGVEGNGKTFFSKCIEYAVGKRYTQSPRADQISSKFNDWQYRSLFVMVEDIYVPAYGEETLEILKPMITSTRGMIEPKGGKKVMRDICCNYILNSNHKDGIRKAKDGRRFSMFYTAQQSEDDLKRDKIDRVYVKNLYDWAESGGYANVAYFLKNFDIPDEYNPTLCARAPATSSTSSAISQGLGMIEQEINEMIEKGAYGFKGGWVSSISLDNLLVLLKVNKQIPPNKRRDLMKNIGYDIHPMLKDGRLPTLIPLEGGKPRLYIKEGSEHMKLRTSQEIAKTYMEDQRNT